MSYAAPFGLQRGTFQHSSALVDKDVDIMASLERDAGFCSAEDDEELDDLHSPTDVSEDSVEVKVEPISLRNKNKRKCAEPRKVASDEPLLAPYKKRRHFMGDASKSVPEDRYHVVAKKSSLLVKEDLTPVVTPRSCVSPFRPWSHPRVTPSERRNPSPAVASPSTEVSPPPRQYTERVPELPNQNEPLSLVLKSKPAETKPRDRKSSGDADRRADLQPLSFPARAVIKTEYETPAEQPRKLEIPGYDHRRLQLGDSSSDASSDLRRLPFVPAVEIKREPGQTTPNHPFTITRPPQEDDRYRPSHEEAVDFTMSAATSVRQSEPSCSYPRVPEMFRGRRTLSEMANDDRVVCSAEEMSARVSQPKFNVDSLLSGGRDVDERAGSSSTPSMSSDKKNSPSSGQQRNYKNMTRERRVEANARERTRVHTISAAFDTLRRTIPAYSHNQKLSKLSVLRIACSYILTLSRVAGSDYSADSSEPSLADCVDYVSRTIQTEGKLRKKKDE